MLQSRANAVLVIIARGELLMRSRFASLISAVLALVGCSDGQTIKTNAGKLTQTHIDAIVDRCGARHGLATIVGDQVVIRTLKTDDIMLTGCVLKALQATGETSLRAVGNQRYDMPQK